MLNLIFLPMLCFCCFPYSCFWFSAGSLNFSHKYQLEGTQLVVILANQTFVDQKGLFHTHMKTRALSYCSFPFLGGFGRSLFSHYVGPPGYILFRELSIIILFFFFSLKNLCHPLFPAAAAVPAQCFESYGHTSM